LVQSTILLFIGRILDVFAFRDVITLPRIGKILVNLATNVLEQRS